MATFEKQIDATANYIFGIAMILEGISLDYNHEPLHEQTAAIRKWFGELTAEKGNEQEEFGEWSDNIAEEFKLKLGLKKWQYEAILCRKLLDLITKFENHSCRHYMMGYKLVPVEVKKELNDYSKRYINTEKYNQFTNLLIKHAGL